MTMLAILALFGLVFVFGFALGAALMFWFAAFAGAALIALGIVGMICGGALIGAAVSRARLA
jgi:hypothetical protein